jgi:hypothetical protein
MKRFNVEGSYPMDEMLENQIEGRVDSWAIRWQATCVLNDWLILYPNKSMSNHIESLKNTHAPVNILPPLETQSVQYRTIDAEVNTLVLRALKRGYAGISNYEGALSLANVRAWVRYLIPNALLTAWRRTKRKRRGAHRSTAHQGG